MDRSRVSRIAPLLTIFLVVGGLRLAGALEYLERPLMDARFGLAPRQASGDVVLVSIDPRSLRELDVWPWDRQYHASIVDALVEAGAQRIGIDIDFSSRRLEDPDQDRELEHALQQAGRRVVLPVFHQWEQQATGVRLATTAPLPRFSRHVDLGSINIRPGGDGLVRRFRTRGPAEGQPAAFAVAVAGIEPQNLEHEYYIDFGIAAQSIPQLSYIDVLAGRFDPAAFAGRHVIIGATAVELGDQVAVPRWYAVPGPLLQALAAESLLQGRALRRLGLPWWSTTTLLLGLIVGPWLLQASWRRGLAALVTAAAGLFGLAVAVQRVAPVILDVAPWLAMLSLTFAYSLIRRIELQRLKLVVGAIQLRRTQSFAQHFVENSPDAILTITPEGSVESFNPAAQSLFAPDGEPLGGRPIAELLRRSPPEQSVVDPARPARAAQPCEAVALRRDGREIPVEITMTRLALDKDARRVLFIRDVTERKSHQQTLEYRATHDVLTNLPNRFLLGQRMEQVLATAWEERHPVALMMLDLDRFKEINDTLGHHTGDMLLQAIAARLSRPLRPGDTIARFGGDEFAVLLPQTDHKVAWQMAWTLVDALSDPFQVDGLSLSVDTSVGIAMFPEHGHEAEELIPRADVAMYVAKRARAAVALYHPEQDNNSLRHLTLTGALRDALEGGDLSLHYQPKISAASGRVVGAEALVRWTHAEHGRIPPDEFISLAENSGLIGPLTLWVLETGLQQLVEWRRNGLEVGLSVNVSARNLLEEKLPRTLRRLLDETRIPPELIQLEITESVIMEDPDKALLVLTELSQIGVGISIDDFGTGYSSLGYLKKLPAREIKIDQSFVREMDHNEDDAKIVKSTIELAHNLGLVVVAEGVESGQTWRRLIEMGCDYGQGYYFSKPLTPDHFLYWLGLEESREAASSF